ncbi:histidine phosphatase family protein [Cellulomonas bogoriensis]|uniref:Fructose-2,6-bisphosphatase n=2 Tax=Cellulomonas bogoriensis TaxID=301388 RepID=A0A0A0BKI0_9CELL|nr:histidine phosphatase family protein [Cellulomonas bogoriensis]KGM08355.1 fructose-2,6-bisphosphatase [Cellulomonas bogoriensis 69B4 = DSM 16987]
MRFDDARPVTVVLVRHGETELTERKALSGSSEPGPALTARGRVQAAQAADLVFRIGTGVWPDLPRPGRLLASPMVRTQETGAVLGRRLGLVVETHEAFAEVDFGEWQGLQVSDVEDRWPGLLRTWYEDTTVPAPGGESLDGLVDRVGGGLAELLAQGVDRTVVVATHAMAIRAAVGVTLGLPGRALAWLRVLPGSVTVVRWWPDGSRELVCAGLQPDL